MNNHSKTYIKYKEFIMKLAGSEKHSAKWANTIITVVFIYSLPSIIHALTDFIKLFLT